MSPTDPRPDPDASATAEAGRGADASAGGAGFGADGGAAGEAPESRLTRAALLLPVICAPLGLLIAILASFMISSWRVTHSAIVQAETRWRADEALALRVHVLDGDNAGIPGATVRASLRRGEQAIELAELRDRSGTGATQGMVRAPAWTPGPAELELEIRGGAQTFREVVAVELGAERAARRGTLTVSTSVKNWIDDTEPQPERLRIALRPLGRLAAGFENTLLVRVTDPEGRPHVGPVEVHLLDGEFGPHRGTRDAPVRVVEASTDASGLLRFDGLLSTDVLRFEVRVPAPTPAAVPGPPAPCGKCEAARTGESPAPGEPTAPAEPVLLGTRKFRLVSFAGAVRVSAEPLAVAPGGTLAIKARGLRARRPVFVDLHGPDGAWIDSLDPVLGPEPPREWTVGPLAPGFLQIEAYQFTTSPGESTALARVQITAGEPDTDAALAPLFAQQRALLELGRVEKGFDRELERRYLDALERADIAAADVPLARAWLMGTLPIEVLGPPVALATLGREQAEVAARKLAWAVGLRWFVLGGGGAFLLLTLLLIVISHRRAAARLTREIHGADATATIAREIREAQRAVLLRAVALVVTMGLGLVLTVIVLDKLLWKT